MDKHFFKEAPYFGLEFIKNLQTEEQFTFKPANDGLTIYGESLSLGFSCLALKSYFMTSEWDKLTEEQVKDLTETSCKKLLANPNTEKYEYKIMEND